MHRTEEGEEVTTAGLKLANLMIQKGYNYPLLCFTSEFWLKVIKERWPYISAVITKEECAKYLEFTSKASPIVEAYQGARMALVLESKTAYPTYWREFTEHIDVELPRDGDEFKKLEKLMNDTLVVHDSGKGLVNGKPPTRFVVTKIIRIQDMMLWKEYNFKKDIMVDRYNKLKDTGDFKNSEALLQKQPLIAPCISATVREFYLFHGTSFQVADIVKVLGFDERVASVTGMFGAGIYLAENSSKSNQYVPCSICGGGNFGASKKCNCQDDDPPESPMFILRALLGDFHRVGKYDEAIYKGTKEKPIRRPPQKPNSTVLYDSIVAEPEKYGGCVKWREFIIYDRHQVYPEYLVHYKRKAN